MKRLKKTKQRVRPKENNRAGMGNAPADALVNQKPDVAFLEESPRSEPQPRADEAQPRPELTPLRALLRGKNKENRRNGKNFGAIGPLVQHRGLEPSKKKLKRCE